MYPGRNFPPRRQNRRENVNESIRVREVRAVFPDGTTEVMPTAAALRKAQDLGLDLDRKSTRLNSSHLGISYAVFCLKKKHQNSLHSPFSSCTVYTWLTFFYCQVR